MILYDPQYSDEKFTPKVFSFKDSNRNYYYLKIEQENRFEKFGKDKNDKDYYWEYEIWAEVELVGSPNKIYKGSILGDYNEQPTLDEFILDYHNHITCLLMGFVSSCKYGLPERSVEEFDFMKEK